MRVRHGPVVDYKLCIGCKTCYNNCPDDVYSWDEDRDQPLVAYPDECHYCAICELDCPQEAISVRLPLHALVDIGIYPRTSIAE